MWGELSCRILPLPQFLKKWIISCLAGSSPEVRGCLLTWAGISLKTAQSNCGFEVTHITDGAVNIAPTRLGAFPPELGGNLKLHLLWRKKIYHLSHTGFFGLFFFFIKRGPAINQSCNHPCNHINHSPQPYLRHLVHECWGPRWEVLRFRIWFCILFLQCASEIVAARFNKSNCLLWLEKNVQKILFKATFFLF